MLQTLAAVLGIENHPVSHRERLVSGIGACLAIMMVYAASRFFLPPSESVLMVASMGASAALLFSVPHGALSQPWPFVAGHVVSALAGVGCAKLLAGSFWAAPLAVGVAVLAMHYLRCLHPPGGGTALIAVMGGPAIAGLGFGFVLTPVLLNAAILLACAVLFNSVFAWRRYPAFLARTREERLAVAVPLTGVAAPPAIAHEDFVYALSQIDTFIDVTEDDLVRIYGLATRRARSAAVIKENAARIA